MEVTLSQSTPRSNSQISNKYPNTLTKKYKYHPQIHPFTNMTTPKVQRKYPKNSEIKTGAGKPQVMESSLSLWSPQSQLSNTNYNHNHDSELSNIPNIPNIPNNPKKPNNSNSNTSNLQYMSMYPWNTFKKSKLANRRSSGGSNLYSRRTASQEYISMPFGINGNSAIRSPVHNISSKGSTIYTMLNPKLPIDKGVNPMNYSQSCECLLNSVKYYNKCSKWENHYPRLAALTQNNCQMIRDKKQLFTNQHIYEKLYSDNSETDYMITPRGESNSKILMSKKKSKCNSSLTPNTSHMVCHNSEILEENKPYPVNEQEKSITLEGKFIKRIIEEKADNNSDFIQSTIPYELRNNSLLNTQYYSDTSKLSKYDGINNNNRNIINTTKLTPKNEYYTSKLRPNKPNPEFDFSEPPQQPETRKSNYLQTNRPFNNLSHQIKSILNPRTPPVRKIVNDMNLCKKARLGNFRSVPRQEEIEEINIPDNLMNKQNRNSKFIRKMIKTKFLNRNKPFSLNNNNARSIMGNRHFLNAKTQIDYDPKSFFRGNSPKIEKEPIIEEEVSIDKEELKERLTKLIENSALLGEKDKIVNSEKSIISPTNKSSEITLTEENKFTPEKKLLANENKLMLDDQLISDNQLISDKKTSLMKRAKFSPIIKIPPPMIMNIQVPQDPLSPPPITTSNLNTDESPTKGLLSTPVTIFEPNSPTLTHNEKAKWNQLENCNRLLNKSFSMENVYTKNIYRGGGGGDVVESPGGLGQILNKFENKLNMGKKFNKLKSNMGVESGYYEDTLKKVFKVFNRGNSTSNFPIFGTSGSSIQMCMKELQRNLNDRNYQGKLMEKLTKDEKVIDDILNISDPMN